MIAITANKNVGDGLLFEKEPKVSPPIAMCVVVRNFFFASSSSAEASDREVLLNCEHDVHHRM